ncbi:MAG: ribonuclease HI family protein [Candidatus Omnitrophica bacterium]|nr:ribonuclease HI family protein [Candidatus Omnitrophota bacterium]
MRELTIYIDGASKGNPGPSGIGVVICEKGETIKNVSSYIGKGTNNVAEYTALIFGLQQALILKAEKVRVHSDSQLLCRQLKGEYKIKNQNLIGLYNQAVRLIAAFKDVEIKNIPRQQNKGADKLANQAVANANA